MKERLKTFLLLSLVSISMLITQKLWLELPKDFLKNFERDKEVFSVSYLLSDMITPNKYLLNFNAKNHTMVYDDYKYGFWASSRGYLMDVLESKNIKIVDITKDEYLIYQNNKSIVFHFPEQINTNILAKAWNVKKPNDIVDAMPSLNSIYIYLGNGDPFFVFSGKDKHIAIYDNNIDTIRLKEELSAIEVDKEYPQYYLMKDIVGTENDIHIPLDIENILPRVFVSNEIAILNDMQKGKLAERFLQKEIGYIRELVERNGSIIYAYNNRYLKLNINGTLEYFHALEKTVTDRNLYYSLSTAAEFITQKTGVQKGMYLAKVEEIQSGNSLGYKLSFRYRVRGIPVILGNREVGEYIQMDVFNDHIRNYRQYVRKDMNLTPNTFVEKKTMLSAFDVLDMNYELLEMRYLMNNSFEEEEKEEKINRVLNSIEDITLAYYDPCLKDKEERLIGVWAIRLNGRLMAFDAYNGSLVYER